MMKSPPLKGKTLPVQFVYAWTLAYFEVLWPDGGLGVIGMAFHDWFEKITDIPLYPYYEGETSQFKPIDYWFLEQVRQNIADFYNEGYGNRVSQQIGLSWWKYLGGLIGNDIVQPVREDSAEAGSLEASSRVACHRFVDVIGNDGGISIELLEHDDSLTIKFTDCPFCSNKLPACNMLFGLVQGMLKGEASVTELKLEGNNSHDVVINFVGM